MSSANFISANTQILLQIDVHSFNYKCATVRHGVARVNRQIEQCGFELPCVGQSHRQRVICVHPHLDTGSECSRQQVTE